MKSKRNANYKRSLLPAVISLVAISGIIVAVPFASAGEIPVWVKGIASFWVDDSISDQEFGDAIIFLIENDILKLDLLEDLKERVTELENEKAYILERGSLEGFTSDMEVDEGKKTIYVSILQGASEQGGGVDYKTCNQNCQIEYFSMSTLEIEPGTTIVWTNEDSVPHNINSGVRSFSRGGANLPDGYMVSGDILPGQSFTFTIDRSGIIRYFDTNYPWVDGTIISFPVTDSVSVRDYPTDIDKDKK